MAERTLRELVTPDMAIQTLRIEYLDLDVVCELKYGLTIFCQSFMVFQVKTHKHLKEFHFFCTAMRSFVVLEEHIKLKAFPFSLQDATKY